MKNLAEGIRRLARNSRAKPHPLEATGQLWDRELLTKSELYRKSRQLFRKQKGKLEPALVTSPRSLSSSILLENRIEYTPLREEVIWTATDPIQKKKPGRLLELRTYGVSLYHEQNHRILWKLLPSPPSAPAALRRYLNFAESVIIALDVALGDEIQPPNSELFYHCGVIYDPGTQIKDAKLSRREYRNYLQAYVHATYLNLELYDPKEIQRGLSGVFPHVDRDLIDHAAERACRLDREFVQRTNLFWQKKHGARAKKALSKAGSPSLILSDDPMDNRQQYLVCEKVFELYGL